MVFRFGIGEPNVANPSQQNGKLGEHRGDAGNMFSYGCDSIMPKSTSLLRGNQPRESAPDDQVPTHILSEEVISLNKACKELPPDNRPHPSTIWRWAKIGVRGVKLETLKISGTATITSRQAVTRFIVALNRENVR
jgi:hypothetical protein